MSKAKHAYARFTLLVTLIIAAASAPVWAVPIGGGISSAPGRGIAGTVATAATPTELAAAPLAGRGVGALVYVSSTASQWTYQSVCPSTCDGVLYCATATGGTGCWLSSAGLRGGGSRLKLWFLGDSHTEGKVPTVSVAGSEVLGSDFFASPLDRVWKNGAWSPFFRADANAAVVASASLDPNVGIATGDGSTNGTQTFAAWVPWMLRSGIARNLIGIDLIVTGAGGSSSYTWAGEQAGGFIAGLLAPSNSDTVTVCGQTYTFRTALSSGPTVPYEVLISTATGSILNLANAVGAEGTAGSTWSIGTAANSLCFFPNPASTTYGHVFALSTGTAGNALTIAASNTSRVTAVDGGLSPISSIALSGGSATSNLYAENKAKLLAGFGTPDVVAITLGTNDAARADYRGRGTVAELTKLVAKIHSDYPSALIGVARTPKSATASPNEVAIAGTILPGIDALVAGSPSYLFSVDLHAIGSLLTGNTGIVGSDGVHLTRYGYRVMADVWARGIAATPLGN